MVGVPRRRFRRVLMDSANGSNGASSLKHVVEGSKNVLAVSVQYARGVVIGEDENRVSARSCYISSAFRANSTKTFRTDGQESQGRSERSNLRTEPITVRDTEVTLQCHVGERVLLTPFYVRPIKNGLIRITDPLHDNRLLVLLEAQDPNRHTFSRLGEVGFTREGVAFARDESYPLCVVTEGRGTIQVSFKGKTYWVCCTGCRDLFKDHPERILGESAAREKAAAKNDSAPAMGVQA